MATTLLLRAILFVVASQYLAYCSNQQTTAVFINIPSNSLEQGAVLHTFTNLSSSYRLLDQEECPRDTFSIGGQASISLILLRTISFEQPGEVDPICIHNTTLGVGIISIRTYKCFILMDNSVGIPVIINIEPEFHVDVELIFPKTFYSGLVVEGMVEGMANVSISIITPEFRAHTQPKQILLIPSYRLTGNFSELFYVIEQQAGCVSYPVIKVLGTLNREMGDYYEVTLEAYASYSTPNASYSTPNPISASTTVGIRVLDQNDHAPQFEELKQSSRVMVNGSILPGTELIRFHSTDMDLGRNGDIRFSLPNTTTSFTVHPLSGTIFSFKSIQSPPTEISLTIVAQDLGEPSQSTLTSLTVFIDGAIFIPPQISIHSLGGGPALEQQIVLRGNVYEGISLGEPVTMINVTGQESSGLSLSLTNIGPCECFNLTNPTPITNGLQYTLSVADSLDFESIPNGLHAVILTATENGVVTTLELSVEVADINEVPSFERTSYEISIVEGVPIGTLLDRVSATDPDGGVNGMLNYSLSDSMNLLEIDSRSGLIYSTAEFDHESLESVQIGVRVEDGGGQSDTAVLILSVVDRNDNAPVFTEASIDKTMTISETHDSNQAIFQFVAIDMDSDCNGAVEYTIFHADPQDVFFLDSTSGVLYPLRDTSLDYESFQTALVVVRATDLGEPLRLFSETTFSIQLSDVNDEIPVIDPIGCPCFIVENTAPLSPNTNCPPLSAFDQDSSDLTFEIANGNMTLFEISSTTGVVSIKTSLDREREDSYQLEIIACDGTLRSIPASLVVIVVDVNDDVPKYSESVINLMVPSDARQGDFVADLSANQTDIGYNALTTYAITNGDSSTVTEAFRLDPTSGFLYVRNSVSLSDSPYDFVVRARDQLLQNSGASVTVTITVSGLRNNPPVFELTIDHRTIAEDIITSLRVTQIMAIDTDSGSNGDLTYSIEESSSNHSGIFMLQPGGLLTVTQSVSGMAGNIFVLNISACDGGSSPLKAYQLLVITVFSRTFGQTPLTFDVTDEVCHYSGAVAENNDAVVSISMLPNMRGNSAAITYTIMDGEFSSAFRISTSGDVIETNVGFANVFTGREAIFVTLRAEYNSNFYFCSVTVAIEDTNNNPPVFDTMMNPLSFTLYDVTSTGASVYRVTASDSDSGSNVIAVYNIINSDEVPFSIDAATGVISVRGELTQLIYAIDVTASDPSFPQETAMTTVTAVVIGTPNSPPVLSPVTAPIQVRETSRAMVATLMTADNDGDRNQQGVNFFCIASGNLRGSFRVLREGGEVLPTSRLDYESLPSDFNLTIMAYDTSLNPAFDTTVVQISLQDDNEEPVFSVPVYRATVTEIETISVINVTASDEDSDLHGRVTYTVQDTNIPFTVDSLTGHVMASGTLNIQNRDSYTFNVTASDGGTPPMSAMAEVQVTLLDINNNPPRFIDNVNTVTVAENVEIGHKIVQVNAMDEDRGINALLRYSILSGDERRFSIDPFSGSLRVAQSLDYEISPTSYNLMLQVCDLGIPPQTCSSPFQLTVEVTDVNDHYPVYSSREYNCEIREKTDVFLQACQVSATDGDGTGNQVIYSIVGTSIFEIDSSGVITVVDGRMIPSLDRFAEPLYILQVQASDSHPTEPRISAAIVKVDIIDSNDLPYIDLPPNTDQTLITYLFHEDIPINSLLFFAHFHDADRISNFSTVTYGILGTDTPFRVDGRTGAVFLDTILDYEEMVPLQAVTVIATNNFNNDQVTSVLYTFMVGISNTNENSLPPIFDPDCNPSAITLSRTLPVHSSVLTMNASDPEGDVVRYDILGGSGLGYFQINQSSGEITVRFSLASKSETRISLEIRAIDSITHPLSAWHELVIILTPGTSSKPFFIRPVFLVNPSENSRDIVSAVSAEVNGQIDTSLCYTIIEGNNGRTFSIDRQTGAISLSTAATFDRETEPLYNVTVSVTKPGVSGMSRGLLVVELEDANDNRPNLTPGGSGFAVFENFPVGESERVARIFAVDKDIGILSYSLTSKPDIFPFILNGETGDLYLTQSLNRMVSVIYAITIEARDNGSLSTTRELNITVDPPAPISTPRPILSQIPTQSLSENTDCGTHIVTVTLENSGSISNTLIYRIVEQSSKVSILPNTGYIYLTDDLDYEVETMLQYTVEVLDGINSPVSTILTIMVTNVNDNRPTFNEQSYSFELREADADLDAQIGRVEASDRDDNIMLTYSIVDSMHPSSVGLFTVGETSGLITIVSSQASAIDREELPVHILTVAVVDNGNPSLMDYVAVTITLLDSDDHSPLFRPPNIDIFVQEDLPSHEVIYRVAAFDPDEGANAEVHYNLLTLGTPFSINSTTGDIKLSNSLDAEIQQIYSLEVRASNPNNPSASFSPTNLNITVSVLDVLNSNPVLTYQTPARIRENYPVYSYVTRIQSSSTARQVYYSIIGGNALGYFMIEPLTGVVRTTLPLDREDTSSYLLVIQGAYDVNFVANISIPVTVDDVNDEKPRFLPPFQTVDIPENSPSQIPLANLNVEDPDEGENGTISSFVITDSYAAEIFLIDNLGNVILRQNKRLDRENDFNALTFQVYAIDSGTPAQYSSAHVRIVVTDANDRPQFEEPEYTFFLGIPVELGTSLFRVQALDGDTGSNGKLAYSIESEVFSIDDDTSGNISIIDNFMLQDQYFLKVTATDGGGLTASTNVTILVRSCNFRNLTFSRNSLRISVSIPENTSVGYVIVNSTELQVIDFNLQEGMLPNVEFSFSSPEPSFDINPQNGEITIVSLDRELQQIHKLVVQATDQSNPSRIAQAQVLVTVLDINDEHPQFFPSVYSFFFSNEDPEPQQVRASDADEGLNAAITYSLTSDPSNSFRVDSNTGIITLVSIPSTTQLQLIITAVDSGDPPLSTNAIINIFIVDSMAPRFAQSVYSVVISENISPNSIIVNVTLAESSPSRQVSFRFGQDTPTGNPFSISSSGVVTIVAGVDYEDPSQRNYNLTLSAQDTNGRVGSALLFIQVLDFNDGTPRFQPNSFYSIQVPEDTQVETVILQVNATDSDISATRLTYRIEGDSSGLFSIENFTGSISLRGELDYEEFRSYEFMVYAEDMGSPPLTGSALVIVQVTNINDNPPMFEEEVYSATIRDNDPPGPIRFISATDPDDPNNLDVPEYSIIPSPGSEIFTIAVNGRVNLNVANFTQPSYTLNISAFDGRFYDYSLVVISVEGVNTHIPMFSSDTYRATVLEGASSGIFITQVMATDMDTGANGQVTYFLLETESRFNIDSVSGVITTASGASGIDRETTATFAISVIAVDGGSFSNNADLILTVEDANDNPPSFNSLFYIGTVMHRTDAGTEILTVTAFDLDSGDNGRLTYGIEEENQLIFEIDSDSGVIKNSVRIDIDIRQKHEFVVTVRDNGSPPLNGTRSANVTISIFQGDLPPSFEQTTYKVTVLENVTIGTTVLEARLNENTTSECDMITSIGLTGANTDFRIQGNSIVTTTNLKQRVYTVLLNAVCIIFSSGETINIQATVIINVTDVNDPPRFSSAINFYRGSTLENLRFAIVQLDSPIMVTDKDNDSTVIFTLLDNTDTFDITQRTGIITTITELDYENITFYIVSVQARDEGTPPLSATATVRIQVNDTNDNPPIFNQTLYSISVPENTTVGTRLFTPNVTDVDRNSSFSYNINGSTFAINQTSGEITLHRPIDRENRSRYDAEISVSDGIFRVIAALIVTVIDSNDEAPVFIDQSYEVTIPENYPVGQSFIQVSATDRDEGDNAVIVYELLTISTNKTVFVNSSTGEVSFLVSPDYEEAPQMSLNVRATDIFNEHRTSAVIIVRLTDENDNYPEFNFATYTAHISENLPTGSNVIIVEEDRVEARDGDNGVNGTVRYFIEGQGANYFNISNGDIVSSVPFDRESNSSFEIFVVATDLGSPPRSGNATVLIEILDRNDNNPVFPLSRYSLNVSESVLVGSVIFTERALDADSGENGEIQQYLLSGFNSEDFGVNVVDGNITVSVNRTLDHETESRREYDLTIIAIDRGFRQGEASLVIHVIDFDEFEPEFNLNSYTSSVLENATINATITRVFASDRDASDQAQLYYSIRNEANFPEIGIDAATGEISVASSLDRESVPSYILTVVVSDEMDSLSNITAQVTITVIDVNDNPPRFFQHNTTYYVQENNVGVTTLDTFRTYDEDENTEDAVVTYRIAENGNEGNFFQITSIGGVLVVSEGLDREMVAVYNLTITAQDDVPPFLIGTTNIIVQVTDINDNSPTGGHQDIYLYLFYGVAPLISLGEVFVNDSDVINNHTYTLLHSDGEENILIRNDGSIRVSTSVPQVGTYGFTVTISDLHNTTNTTISLLIRNITEDTLYNSFSMQFTGVIPQDFVDDHLGSFLATSLGVINRELSGSFDIQILSIQPSSSPSSGHTDVTIATQNLRDGSYITPLLVQHVIHVNRNEIETSSKVRISTESVDMCSTEICNNTRACTNRYQESLSNVSLGSRSITYLGISILHSYTCDSIITSPCDNVLCNEPSYCALKKTGRGGGEYEAECLDDCSSDPCKNDGTCIVQNPGYYCQCPDGYDGRNCELSMANFGSTSYVIFPALESRSSGNITLDFNTKSDGNGLLLYSGRFDAEEARDSMYVELLDTYACLRISYGEGGTSPRPACISVKSWSFLGDGLWHTLIIRYNATSVSFSALTYNPYTPDDGSKTLERAFHSLDLGGPLILGKLPPDVRYIEDEIPSSIPGFSGCMRNVKINGVLMDFANPILQSGLTKGCNSAECSPNPCNNGGRCFGKGECDCKPEFTDPLCTQASDSVTFFGKDFISYRIVDTRVQPLKRNTVRNYRTAQNVISFSFTTKEMYGALLQLGDPESSEYAVFEIQNGHIQLRYNLGNGEDVFVLNSVKVSDALPHTVALTRSEGSHELILDDKYVNRTTSSIGSGEDVILEICPDQIYLGAEVNVENETIVQGFNGCLAGVKLDGREFPFAENNNHFEIVKFTSSNIISGCPVGTLVESMQPSLYVYSGLGAILAAVIIIAVVFVTVCAAGNAWRRSRHGEHSVRQNNSGGGGGGSRTGSPSHGGFSWQPAYPSDTEDQKISDVSLKNLKGRPGRDESDGFMETNFDDPVALQIPAHNRQQGSQSSSTTPFHSRQSSHQSGKNQAVPTPLEGFSAVNQANPGYLQESPINSDREEDGGNRLVRQMRSFSGQQSVRSDGSSATYIPSELLGMDDNEVSQYIKKKVEIADADNENHDIDTIHHYKEEGPFEPMGSIGSLYDIVKELDEDVTLAIPPSSPTSKENVDSPITPPQIHVSPAHPTTYLSPPGDLSRTSTAPSKPVNVLLPPGQGLTNRTRVKYTLVELHPPAPPGQKTNPLVLSNPVANSLPNDVAETSSSGKKEHSTPLTSTSASQPDNFCRQEDDSHAARIRRSKLQRSARRAKRNVSNNDVQLLANSKLRRSARGANRITSQNQNINNILEKFHNITAGGDGMSRLRAGEEVKVL